MPVYTFRCIACGTKRDEFRWIREMDEPQLCGCGGTGERVFSAPRVISDIEPYRATAHDVATGGAPIINSRGDHREFLRRNGYVEMGTDAPRRAADRRPCREVTGRDIANAMERLGL